MIKEVNKKQSRYKSWQLLVLVTITILVISACQIGGEVSNAFKNVDKSLASSNSKIQTYNDSLKNTLIEDENYRSLVQDIENTSSKFNSFLDSVINVLILNSGGWKENSRGRELANPRNAAIPTQILVQDGLGEKLKLKILETRAKYTSILKTNFNNDSLEIPLKIIDLHIIESGMTWVEYNFGDMPLTAVLPLLRKIVIDENESKAIIYRHLANIKR